MNHLNKPLATVLVVSWTLGITSAHGQLRYDLRFDDDTRTRVPAVGQHITPTFHASVFGPYYATFRRDGSLLGVTTQSASPFGAFVTFAVPEPDGIGSLCIGAALLARRRRTSAAVQHTTA